MLLPPTPWILFLVIRSPQTHIGTAVEIPKVVSLWCLLKASEMVLPGLMGQWEGDKASKNPWHLGWLELRPQLVKSLLLKEGSQKHFSPLGVMALASLTIS